MFACPEPNWFPVACLGLAKGLRAPLSKCCRVGPGLSSHYTSPHSPRGWDQVDHMPGSEWVFKWPGPFTSPLDSAPHLCTLQSPSVLPSSSPGSGFWEGGSFHSSLTFLRMIDCGKFNSLHRKPHPTARRVWPPGSSKTIAELAHHCYSFLNLGVQPLAWLVSLSLSARFKCRRTQWGRRNYLHLMVRKQRLRGIKLSAQRHTAS